MKRDASIDALRGLAIVLVVVGHTITIASGVFHDGPGLVPLGGGVWVPAAAAHNLLLSLVYSFHMPLMGYVSGLVMWPPRTQPLGEQIVRRAKTLLVPYAVWNLIIYGLMLEVGPPRAGGIGAVIVDAVLGRTSEVWYLGALFICAVILVALVRAPGARYTLPGSALLAVAVASGLLFGVPHVAHLVGGVLWIYPFMVLGYLRAARRAEGGVARRRWPIVAAGVALYLPLFALRYPIFGGIGAGRLEQLSVWMYEAGLPGGHLLYSVLEPVLYRASLLPYLCALGAVVALDALYAGRKGALVDVQAWVGRRSLGIYALHISVLWWAVWAGVQGPWLLFPISLGVSLGLTALIERIPVLDRVLLGQRGCART